MDGNFKRNLIIGFGLSLTILMVSSIASYLSIKSLLESTRLVNHTQEVIYNLNEGTSVAVGAQTSMRGFIVTGKTIFLEDYRGAQQPKQKCRGLQMLCPVQPSGIRVC